jgi:hypothetical protein
MAGTSGVWEAVCGVALGASGAGIEGDGFCAAKLMHTTSVSKTQIIRD